jgi:RHS repeat-associated protein
MQNTGATTWTSAAGYQLGSQNPQDNTAWGPSRVALPHDVAPGQSAVFVFPVTAPATVGSHNFQWKMIHGSTWFGSSSTNVAVDVQAQSSLVNYIHVDHLNTPRLISDSTGTAVWKWDQQEPFGVSPPDKNPSSLGVFEFPLRFAGQYDDPETGLFYNYLRDCYDPVLGRYCQSDPIGLGGGLHTYVYVDSDPLRFTDRFGLQSRSDVFGEKPRPPAGWPNASQQAQQNLAQQLQQLWNNIFNQSEDDKNAAAQYEQALKKCIETTCDPAYDRGRAWCESQWKMVGRQAEKYRTCMNGVRSDYLECIEQCKKDCKK